MKATEALKITESAFSSKQAAYLNNIYKKIEITANQGSKQLKVNSSTDHPVDSIIRILKNNGYTVTREAGYDHRDGTSWDVLIISWENPK